jgi:hypothetical protein
MSHSKKRSSSEISSALDDPDSSDSTEEEDDESDESDDGGKTTTKDVNLSIKDKACDVCRHCGSPTKRLIKNDAMSPMTTCNNEDEDSPEEEDYEEDYDDGPKTCVICGSAPCEWENFGAEIIEDFSERYDLSTAEQGFVVDYGTATTIPNNQVRFQTYCAFTYNKYGSLDKDNRMPPPDCAMKIIREKFPDPDGKYVGFKASKTSTDTASI